jgi:Ca2+/Na+ antiporter
VSSDANGRTQRLEIVATILLALATVATAWSGYQASRWNGEQALAFSRASALRIESSKADALANAQTQVDVATFTQWVDAVARDEVELAAFYSRRFREEFKPAVDAWSATMPLTNESAPLTPFAMPEYKLAARDEAARLEGEAEGLSATGRANVQRATNYVLGVVLFAAALFFAGMSAKLRTPGLSKVLLGFGVVVFVATVAWIATFPISFSI